MRYGFCTGFATPMKDAIDYALLADVREAGYHFAEFPLMQVAALSDDAFAQLRRTLPQLGLGADSACNLFAPSLRLTGPDARREPVHEYLAGAFERLGALGTRKLVFGSSGARNLPAGTSTEEGYRQLAEMIEVEMLPLLEAYGITLLIEPIGGYEANFIRTLPEGMALVEQVNHPRVRLLADSVHLLWEREDPQDIARYAAYLGHVHICESERVLPVAGYSAALARILDVLRATGYHESISFEPMPYGRDAMAQALRTLRATMEGEHE